MGNSLIVLPTYCEASNLPLLLPRLTALAEPPDVLVVDDASPDGTGEVAEELRCSFPSISVLHRARKEGLGPAYVSGFKEAMRRGYGRIVTMDADLSHAPEDVPRLLRALEGAEVAIGSRHVPGGGVESWPLWRRALSRGGSLYARTLLGLGVGDVTGGFRAYRTEALRALDLDSIRARGFVFQVEILARILDLPDARAVEVPILFRNRTRGRSKLTGRIVREAALEVLRLARGRKRRGERQLEPPPEPPGPRPLVSVIVPVRPDAGSPASLAALPALDYPRDRLEVVLARGREPSRQRNLAVGNSAGEYLLFLDDDSVVTPALLAGYVRAFERDPELAAVGGPAESAGGTWFQGLAALVLGEPWVMGRSAARYRALGRARETDERELILCNLALRRRAFESAGGFDETLYPNEENELMERLRASGWRLRYDPAAVVTRPQRETPRALLGAIFSYGAGRRAQIRRYVSRIALLRGGGAALAAGAVGLSAVGAAIGSLALATPALLYAAYLAALSVKLAIRGGPRAGLAGATLAAAVHASYLLGIVLPRARPTAEPRTQLADTAARPETAAVTPPRVPRRRPMAAGEVTLERIEAGRAP